jgi:alkanesulfonate monooxygenase SsuD/methylene tetrahydromethanopterin reductase-like flavin-dependent oxidoreductase (luciferase family)
VARQLADIGRIAPGRLTFRVGIGGEDRREVSWCGVDPATRGLRMNECLAIVRELLTGQPVTYHGTFFDLEDAVIAPSPAESSAGSSVGAIPYGTADDVAEFLAPYVAAGCTEFNLIPQSPGHDQAIAGVAAVKNLLAPVTAA